MTQSSATLFETGFHPRLVGYVEATYKGISQTKADRAWRSLAAHGREQIEQSRVIAAAMDVSVQSATRYRRVFDALGLTQDIPGEWNPNPLDGYVPRFNGSAIEDDPAYADWSEYADYNIPAVVVIHTHDPDAFTRAVAERADHRPVRILVISRRLPSEVLDNDSPVRFAHSMPGPVWFDRDGARTTCLTPDDNYMPIEPPVYRRETNALGGAWIGGDTASTLVLVPQVDGRGLCPNARSASPSRCLPSETVTIPDLTEHYGWSRATANRRMSDWIKAGDAIRVSRGRYKVLTA